MRLVFGKSAPDNSSNPKKIMIPIKNIVKSIQSVCTVLAVLVLFGGSFPVRAQELLAGWTFNNQTSTASVLTADLGTLAGTATFSTGTFGSGATFTLNGDGTVTLGRGYYLNSLAINSTAYSSLKNNVTIWASFTVLGSPSTNNNSAIFGLLNGGAPLSGASFLPGIALGLQISNVNGSTTTPTTRLVGVLNDGSTTIGPATQSTLTVGAAATSAVVFNNIDATHFSYFDDINGTVTTRSVTSATSTLEDFTSLSVGRLNSGIYGYDTGLVLNEIRVYAGSLTTEQIVAIPEPSCVLLLGLAVLSLLLWKSGRWTLNRVSA